MSIIVTGAAGFIGCNNTIALNKRGYTDILAVDNLTNAFIEPQLGLPLPGRVVRMGIRVE